MMGISILTQSLKSAGVPIKSIESDWFSALKYPDRVVLGERPLNPFGVMEYRFPPTFLRWQYEDGTRRLMWLPAEIDFSGRYPRRDVMAEGKVFFDAIRADYSALERAEREPA